MEGYMDGFTKTTWRSMRSEKYLMEVGPLIKSPAEILSQGIQHEESAAKSQIL
jgi:hypothetical protein